MIKSLQKPYFVLRQGEMHNQPFKQLWRPLKRINEMLLNVKPHLVWLWHWRNPLHEPRPRPPSPQTHTGPQSAERGESKQIRQSRKRKWSFYTHSWNLPILKSAELLQLHVLFIAEHEYETCRLYLAKFKRRAVLPLHLSAVIFGMSYQTPVKCIVRPCEDAAKLNTLNKTVPALN